VGMAKFSGAVSIASAEISSGAIGESGYSGWSGWSGWSGQAGGGGAAKYPTPLYSSGISINPSAGAATQFSVAGSSGYSALQVVQYSAAYSVGGAGGEVAVYAALSDATIVALREAEGGGAIVGPNTVSTTTSSIAGNIYNRKIFYANGRHWVVFYDGSATRYSSSTDGVTWEAPAAFHAGRIDGTDVCFDGTYVHYVYAWPYGAASIAYRRGTPNADGTITWSAAAQSITPIGGATYAGMSICVDTNGYTWLGYLDNASGTYTPYVLKNTNTDGTWTTAASQQLSATSNDGWTVSVLPLTAGKIYAIYSRQADVNGKLFNGSTWGSEEDIVAGISYGSRFSATTDGDVVHLAINASDYDIDYYKRDGSWSGATEIEGGTNYNQYPSLCADEATHDVYAFLANFPSSGDVGYKRRDGSTGNWDANWTAFISDSNVLNEVQNAFFNRYGNYIGVFYMTGTGSPYNVRYAFQDVNPGVGGTWYDDELYFIGTLGTRADKYVKALVFSAEAASPTGVAVIYNAVVWAMQF
ncbi:MAG: hypothetical protein PHZ19_11915, partial [Candidatus Thermoplasmatota archaeon]|nr:hypothetical protein [Candidatus Thermoplasmatota archaeon]